MINYITVHWEITISIKYILSKIIAKKERLLKIIIIVPTVFYIYDITYIL